MLEEYINLIPPSTLLNNEFIDKKKTIEKISESFCKDNTIKASVFQLTPRQVYCINRLKFLIKNCEEKDSLKFSYYIEKLENDVWKSDMTDQEKNIVLISFSIGKYSWRYWSVNKLEELFSGDRKSEKWPPDWQELKNEVIEGDIEGAIAGAIIGCIGGAIGGTLIMPGVGSITACILESVSQGFQGAVVGSTLSALKYLIFD
ncbi:MAG: hypothetical protein ACUVTX_11935 [Bacteroidales bacterium]